MQALRLSGLFLVCLLAGAAVFGRCPGAAAQVLEVKSFQGIPFVTGGIGLDEREELRSVRSSYSLRLVFAVRAGAYLADVNVLVKSPEGMPVFEAVSDGPWLFAALPPGRYSIMATMEGKTLQRTVDLSAGGSEEVHLYWE